MLTNSPALGPCVQKEVKKQMGIVKALHDYMRYRKRRWDTLVSKATTKEILTFLNGKGRAWRGNHSSIPASQFVCNYGSARSVERWPSSDPSCATIRQAVDARGIL
jgi:hypothetical protein